MTITTQSPVRNTDRLNELEKLWAEQMALPESEQRSDLPQLAQSVMELRRQCKHEACPEKALTIPALPPSPIKDILMVKLEDDEIDEGLSYCTAHTHWTPRSR